MKLATLKRGLIITGAAAFCLVVTAPCAAESQQFAALYGNTLIAKDGGIVSHFWYKPDHTFTGIVPAYAFALKGTWTENADGLICRNFDPPLPTMKNPDCGTIQVRKIGDKHTDEQGHSEKLVEGVR